MERGEGRFSPELTAGQEGKGTKRFDEIFEWFSDHGWKVKEDGPGTHRELIDILASAYEAWYDEENKQLDPEMMRELERYFEEKKGAVSEAADTPDTKKTMDLLFGLDFPSKGLKEWQIEEIQKHRMERATTLDLARRAVANLPKDKFAWAAKMEKSLADTIEQGQEAAKKMPNSWVHGRAAYKMRKKYGDDIAPWSSIELGSRSGAFEAKGADREKVIKSWGYNELHPEDEVYLQEKVRDDKEWRETYRKELKKLLSMFHQLELKDFELSLEEETTALRYRLPHLGQDMSFEVKQTEKGLKLCWPGKSEVLVPVEKDAAEQRLKLEVAGDDITGPLEIPVGFYKPSPQQEAWKSVCAANELARGEGGDRAVSVAIAVARRLADDEWLEEIMLADYLFESGEELDPEEMENVNLWVKYALEARIALEEASKILRSKELKDALKDSDMILAAFAPAILFLDEKDYYDLIYPEGSREGEELDEKAWWGSRAALDRLVPEEKLDEVLQGLRKSKGEKE